MHPLLQLMRLDKPIGIWLLFFPAAWAVAFAAPDLQTLFRLEAIMLLGAAVTRAAGCILNDLADRRLDAQVARTRTRPLASGAVTVRQALLLLLLLLALALALALSLPSRVFLLALVALPMIAAYPWMKRITWWPQLFLGLTFNLSALFGWLATGAPLAPPAYTLYAAAILWTLAYDTIYAVQDLEDDAKIGIRSSARALGPYLRPFVTCCYFAMVALFLVTGMLQQAGPFYAVALLGVLAHCLWQIAQLPPRAHRAGAIFRSNQWLGMLLLLGLLADRLLRQSLL